MSGTDPTLNYHKHQPETRPVGWLDDHMTGIKRTKPNCLETSSTARRMIHFHMHLNPVSSVTSSGRDIVITAEPAVVIIRSLWWLHLERLDKHQSISGFSAITLANTTPIYNSTWCDLIHGRCHFAANNHSENESRDLGLSFFFFVMSLESQPYSAFNPHPLPSLSPFLPLCLSVFRSPFLA